MKGTWRRLAFFLLVLPFTLYANVQMTGLRIQPGATHTRFTFFLSQKTFGKIKFIPKPPQVLLVFANTSKHFAITNTRLAGSNIRSLTAKEMFGNVQFLFDVVGPVHWTANFVPTDNRVEFQLDIVSIDKKLKQQPAPKPLKHKMIDPQIFSSTQPDPIFTIAIDAGHGGHDTGAIGQGGELEKTVVLEIAKKLALAINRQPGMKAVLTRHGDYFIPLRGRLQAARRAKADLFIAIHADGFFNAQAKGASVYALSEHGATSEAARWLAKKENYSELGGVELNALKDHSPELRSVLIDMAQAATIGDSLKAGNKVLSQLNAISVLHYKRVEQAPFMVLKSPDIPSILVETGFISNPIEARRLMAAAYQEHLAQAIKTGIQNYIRESY